MGPLLHHLTVGSRPPLIDHTQLQRGTPIRAEAGLTSQQVTHTYTEPVAAVPEQVVLGPVAVLSLVRSLKPIPLVWSWTRHCMACEHT